MMTNATLATVWDSLDHETRVDALGRAMADTLLKEMEETGNDFGLGQLPTIPGQDALAMTFANLLAPLMPALGAKLSEAAGPATEKAMGIMIPKLREQLPLFAAIAGIVTAALVIVGLYIGKKYF